MCFSVNLIIVGQKMIFTESKKSYQDVLICKKKFEYQQSEIHSFQAYDIC